MKRRWLLISTLLSGCAVPGMAPPPRLPSPLPPLRLAPALLGEARIALSQRLTVSRLDRPEAPAQQVEMQLQLDATGLLLAGFALGQRVLLMQWDGSDLQVQRHPRLPPEVDVGRMLRDLCLVFWPVEAVNAALPAGWTWIETSQGRALNQDHTTRLSVQRPREGVVEIINIAEGYRLLIESQPLEPAS